MGLQLGGMSEPELETIACIVVDERERAFLLRDGLDLDREDWFPKSQISFSRRNMKTGHAVAEIPLWLLNEKGWNE